MKTFIKWALYIGVPTVTAAAGYVGGRIHQHGIDVGRAQAAASNNGANPHTVVQAVENNRKAA